MKADSLAARYLKWTRWLDALDRRDSRRFGGVCLLGGSAGPWRAFYSVPSTSTAEWRRYSDLSSLPLTFPTQGEAQAWVADRFDEQEALKVEFALAGMPE